MIFSLIECSLRKNPVLREQLRQKLFTLWGNLEEVKAAQLNSSSMSRNEASPAAGDSGSSTAIRQNQVEASVKKDTGPVTIVHSSKPFNCCIQEYGVHRTEEDCSEEFPCPTDHWDRKFRIFGTTIM